LGEPQDIRKRDLPRRGRGAPPGNTNALKSGLHTAAMRARRREIRLILQKIKITIARVNLVGKSEI
jgi:hypothetical protein